MVEVIRLGAAPKNDNIIRLAKRISPKGITILKPITAVKVLTSPKTTVALATTLGALLGGPVGALKAAGLSALGLGVLQVSPIARKFVREKVKDPTAAGRFVGEKIEEIGGAKLPEDKTLKEKVVTGLKTAGIIGGAAALAAGAVTIVRKIKEKAPTIPSLIAPVVAPAATLEGVPIQTLIQPEPISAIPKEIPAEKVERGVIPQLPSIKNVFKPEVNISFRKKRTFINQQILMK